MPVSSAGIGSGLDVNSIVTQLTELERKPLVSLQARAASIQTKLSAYGQIKSQISALGDAASKLRLDSAWSGLSVKSTNEAAVSASVTGVASAGSYSIEVQKLAKAQSVASATVPVDATVGSGSLSIELGTWDPGFAAFTVTPGGPAAIVVSLTADSTLREVMDKINEANAGVTAIVVRDGLGGERLSVRSNKTGAENGFRIQVTDNDGDSSDNVGLSSLNFDPQNLPGVGLSGISEGGNAKFLLNGLDIESSSNSITQTIPGVTLKLTQETTSPVELTLSQDTASIKKNIQDFVAAYNSLNQTLADATKYDADSKTAGPLQGDTTTNALRQTLRNLVASTSEGSVYSRLADVGIVAQRGGALTVTSTTLDAALANGDELKKLFATNNGNAATDGFGIKIKDFVQGLLSSDGRVTGKTEALQAEISRNGKQQEAVNTRAAAVEKRLRAQYTALDGQIAGLSSINTFLSQQITLWNNQKSK